MTTPSNRPNSNRTALVDCFLTYGSPQLLGHYINVLTSSSPDVPLDVAAQNLVDIRSYVMESTGRELLINPYPGLEDYPLPDVSDLYPPDGVDGDGFNVVYILAGVVHTSRASTAMVKMGVGPYTGHPKDNRVRFVKSLKLCLKTNPKGEGLFPYNTDSEWQQNLSSLNVGTTTCLRLSDPRTSKNDWVAIHQSRMVSKGFNWHNKPGGVMSTFGQRESFLCVRHDDPVFDRDVVLGRDFAVDVELSRTPTVATTVRFVLDKPMYVEQAKAQGFGGNYALPGSVVGGRRRRALGSR